jgi:hypothetical protein
LKTVVALLLTAAAAAAGPAAAQQPARAARGSHDFDFNHGCWHTEITRFTHVFSATPTPARLTGTVSVRPLWASAGGGWLEQIEADGPKGHWQALTLFLYNPESRQWSQNFANKAVGRFDSNPLIGQLRDGGMELYAQDTYDGRSILVRGLWFDIEQDAHSYEESYSNDGGRSWHRAFIGHLTRIKGQEVAQQLPRPPNSGGPGPDRRCGASAGK